MRRATIKSSTPLGKQSYIIIVVICIFCISFGVFVFVLGFLLLPSHSTRAAMEEGEETQRKVKIAQKERNSKTI